MRPGRGRILEVADVAVSFGAVRALDGVSLEVREHQFAGLIGPNGAGKTTLFNVISGFVPPESGRVRLAGRRITDWSTTRRARAGLGRTFQNVGLNKAATVEENLDVAQKVSALRLELAEYLALRRPPSSASELGRNELIEVFGLRSYLDAPVNQLPQGLAKVVELVCVLLRRPRLLLLDEPSSGLSPEETERVGQVLRDVHARHGLTIFMIEHDMSLAMSVCEHIYVLNFGMLIAEGRPKDIRVNPQVIEAYLGQEAV